MKKLFISLLILTQSFIGFSQSTSTFESLPLDASGYWEGADETGGFTDGDAYFENTYVIDETWGNYWSSGFAYSNVKNNTTAGYRNMYAAYPKAGVGKSEKYAIGTSGAGVELTGSAKGKNVTGFYVANTTYAYLSMLNGDQFATKFGGADGNTPDWLLLTITGFLNDVKSTEKIQVYLADFRFTDNSKDYILDTWRWIDTRKLGGVDRLEFEMSASNGSGYDMTTPAYFALDHFNEPLYDAAVGDGGTEAIFKDSPLFKSWAQKCTVTRGYQNIDDQTKGYATYGTEVNGTLKAGVNVTVSLGDNGTAVLEFPSPIKNGEGPDFAVFENGFDYDGYQYLELAFVEVSSDGINYVRFPAISKTNSFVQTGGFGTSDATLLHNLAGKYVANYGTPFDLEELKNNPLLDMNNITHVKLVDVIGTIDLATSTKDSLGNPVNDPFTTTGNASGFDLDAVGVINQNGLATSVSYSQEPLFSIYPNPSQNEFKLSLLNTSFVGEILNVFDAQGVELVNQVVADTNVIDASSWNNGMYYVRVGNNTQKIIKID